MKNYFYSNRLSEQIRNLLDENLSESATKNITIGDLSVLPSPKDLSEYLPATLISLDRTENKFANESMNIAYTPYYFSIYYIYPYTFEGDNDAVRQGKQYAEEIANVLMNLRTLDNFKIPKSEIEIGGLVVHSELSNIKYDSAEQEFFRNMEIPAQIATLEICIGFRTYSE